MCFAAAGPDRISQNFYNLAGERTTLRLGVGTAVEADEETSTFTGNGKLWAITDGEGNKTTYTYDGHDRLRQTNFPHPTTDGVSSTSDYEQLAYDSNGNVTQRRLRDGQLINYTFDNLNRVSLKDLPSPEYDVSYSEYDLQGRIKSRSSSHTLTLTYDALGRNRSETCFLGTMSYSYDSAGRRTQTTWPDGFYVTQDFYETGEVKAIRENGAMSGVGVLATYSFDNLGRRSGLMRGNGTSTSYGYDPVSRLTSLSHDLANNAHDVTTTLTYNPASQIATYSRNNDAYAWAGHHNVNRTYGINGLNQITTAGAATITHDARGNTLTLDGMSLGYTSENRLETIWGIGTLLYDAAGRLMVSSPGTYRRFQYDGTDMTSEHNNSNVLQRRYVHGPGADEPLVWYEGAGTSDRRWFHQDERGSVVAVTNTAGAAIAVNSYDEYGVPSVDHSGTYGYTGQIWIPQIRMSYYKARMYAPSTGRFMQTDPVGYKDGINWYAYVDNDPVNGVDPTGLQEVKSESEPQAVNASPTLAKDLGKPNDAAMQEGPPKDSPYLDKEQTILRDTTGLGEDVQAMVDAANNWADAGEEVNNADGLPKKEVEQRQQNKQMQRYHILIKQPIKADVPIEPAPLSTTRYGADGSRKAANAVPEPGDMDVP